MKVVDSQGTRTVRAHKLYNNQIWSNKNINVRQRKVHCVLGVKRRAGLVVVGQYLCACQMMDSYVYR